MYQSLYINHYHIVLLLLLLRREVRSASNFSEKPGPSIGCRGMPEFYRENTALGAESRFLNGFMFWPNMASAQRRLCANAGICRFEDLRILGRCHGSHKRGTTTYNDASDLGDCRGLVGRVQILHRVLKTFLSTSRTFPYYD